MRRLINASAEGLAPWRDVLQPHDDVASGNFKAADFAADLQGVDRRPDQSKEYTDPAGFFARTYLTEGLRDLISRAVKRFGWCTPERQASSR